MPSLSSHRLRALQSLPPDAATVALTGVVLLTCVFISATAGAADAERILTCALLVLGFVALPIGAALSVLRPTAPVPAPSGALLALCAPRLAAEVACATRSYAAGGGVAAQCTVCLDDVCEGQAARSLPCGHEFHRNCVDSWLLMARKNACPLCTRTVVAGRDGNMALVPAACGTPTAGTQCKLSR